MNHEYYTVTFTSNPTKPYNMKANEQQLIKWSTRNKCWLCKRRFDKAVLLPVKKPVHNKFQPNFNTEILYHLYETHGLPDDIVRQWLIGAIYNMELTLFGIRRDYDPKTCAN